MKNTYRALLLFLALCLACPAAFAQEAAEVTEAPTLEGFFEYEKTEEGENNPLVALPGEGVLSAAAAPYEEYTLRWEPLESVDRYMVAVILQVGGMWNILSGGWVGGGYVRAGESIYEVGQAAFDGLTLPGSAAELDIAEYVNPNIDKASVGSFVVVLTTVLPEGVSTQAITIPVEK